MESARHGGRINADFLDNSAGVDCSDHEVNLKILVDLAVRRGLLDAGERDTVLRDVPQHVVAHVLYDSFLQAQLVSEGERHAPSRLFAYEGLMETPECSEAPLPHR